MAVTCRQVRHLHDAFIDGELSASMTAEVQAHLLQCPECQTQVEWVRTCGQVIAADRGEPRVPADFADRVLNALPAQPSLRFTDGFTIMTRRERRMRLLRRFAGGFVPAAAAVFAVCVAIWPPPENRQDLRGPRLVAGEAQYAPVDAFGFREVIDPTISTLSDTSRVAGRLQDLYQIGMEDARARWGALPPEDAPLMPTPSGAFLMELLHPFTDILQPVAPPQATRADESDNIVRF
jgi:hypothetical protein